MEILPSPDLAELDLARVLSALADPVRLRLVRTFAERGEMSCTQAAGIADLDLSKSTLSHHARILRECGLASVRVEGRTRWLSLRKDELDQRFPGLLDAVLSAAP